MFDNDIRHAGVLGMKWGVRRFQNKDGTLTEAGKKRYAKTGVAGYKSKLTKHHEKYANKRRAKADEYEARGNMEKAEKLRAKADMNERKAKYNAEIDRRMETYAKNVKVGGNIAARLLTGDQVGGKAYQTTMAVLNNQDRHSTTSKLISYGSSIASTFVAGAFGDLLVRHIGFKSATAPQGAMETDETYRFRTKGAKEGGWA